MSTKGDSSDKMKSKNKKKLKILCFGDSLTKGYCQMGFAYYPYGDMLKILIFNELNGEDKKKFDELFEIRSSGVNGEKTNEMIDRLPMEMNSMHPDFVIILAGFIIINFIFKFIKIMK